MDRENQFERGVKKLFVKLKHPTLKSRWWSWAQLSAQCSAAPHSFKRQSELCVKTSDSNQLITEEAIGVSVIIIQILGCYFVCDIQFRQYLQNLDLPLVCDVF